MSSQSINISLLKNGNNGRLSEEKTMKNPWNLLTQNNAVKDFSL